MTDLEISQADREAAQFCGVGLLLPLLAAAFARHRIQSIAAARPVIEAEVRDQCAKVAEGEKFVPRIVTACERDDDTAPGIYNDACSDIAAAIRNRRAIND